MELISIALDRSDGSGRFQWKLRSQHHSRLDFTISVSNPSDVSRCWFRRNNYIEMFSRLSRAETDSDGVPGGRYVSAYLSALEKPYHSSS